MKYTEELLLKYNIKSVASISEKSFDSSRIIITNLDDIKYNYDIKTLEINDNSIDKIIKNHIKKVTSKNRKEKLIRLNEI